MIGDIGGSMAAALQFQNIKMNIFGCEISATPAVSDFYTFGGGGAGQPDSQSPNSKSVSDAAVNSTNSVTEGSNEKPYAEPPANEPDLDFDTPITDQEREATRRGDITDEQGNTIGSISSRGSTY
jgi:hypothetical protein